MKGVNSLIVGVVEIILLIAILSGVTPIVLGYLNALANSSAILNATGDVIGNRVPVLVLLATSALGGILWFVVCILLTIGVMILIIKSASHKGY